MTWLVEDGTLTLRRKVSVLWFGWTGGPPHLDVSVAVWCGGAVLAADPHLQWGGLGGLQAGARAWRSAKALCEQCM